MTIDNQAEIKKIMEIKGSVKGSTLKTDMEFVLKEKGEEGLKQLEKELEKLNNPINYKKIRSADSYPVSLRVFSLLAIKKTFNFDDEKIKEMGMFAARVSFFVKLIIRYYISPQKVFFEKAPELWRKQMTEGELIPVELNEEKKQAVVILKEISLHPLYCYYLRGYMSGILKMLIITKEITCEETKCSFKGDEHHEYLLKWQ